MSMSDQSGPPTKDGVYDCLLDNGETVVLALESQAGTRTLRRPHARFEMCYLHEMEKRIVAHRPHTPPTPAPLKPLASDITQEQANELQDILRTLVPSGVALITSARELVKRYEAAKRYGETREATLAALQEKTEQALAAAEARIKDLEGRLQRIESNARNALLSLGVSEADAETPDPVFSLTVLAIGEHAKLAGLADLADQWAAASHTPMGEAYLVTKTQMANELKQAIAADLVADAVAERCEENTNG
jgi:DNA-binding transcriptional regulator YbjK